MARRATATCDHGFGLNAKLIHIWYPRIAPRPPLLNTVRLDDPRYPHDYCL
ncbi:hypothetical protein IG631_13364 [Alternaria alternata]|nr:hypothetical protein IG631_13364 [Alternaria alternata]